MEGRRCTCGSDAIEFDDSSAETQFVCTSCGTIIEDCSALSSVDFVGTSYLLNDGRSCGQVSSDRVKRYFNKNVPPGKKQGLEMITQLAAIFNLTQDMKQSARNRFCEAYSHMFLNERMGKKRILAACCVYVVMKQYGRPVAYGDFSQYVDCKPNQFCAVYKLYERFKGTKFSEETTEEIVRIVLRDMVVERKEKLIQKTIEICEMCYKCWIMTGRSRKHNVIAAAYVAWASSDYSHFRVKFSKFLSMFSFPKGTLQTAASRVHEIVSFFIKHAKELPWVESSSIDNKRIFLYVDQVLQHFKGLHSSVMSRASSPNSGTDILEYREFRSETKNRKVQGKCSGDDSQHPPADSMAELSDEDISDTEIEKYIRTEAEVAKFIEFQDRIRMSTNVPCNTSNIHANDMSETESSNT